MTESTPLILDEDHDISDPEAIPINIVILVANITVSLVIVILAFLILYFIKTRAVDKIKFLNSLISRGDVRLQLQVYNENVIGSVADKVGADLKVVKEEQVAFGLQQIESKIGRVSTVKESGFKMPANAYDEASFSDKEYGTLYISRPTNNEEVFPDKKKGSMVSKVKTNK